VQAANIFRAVLDDSMTPGEAMADLEALKPRAAFSNGLYYGRPGHIWNSANPT